MPRWEKSRTQALKCMNTETYFDDVIKISVDALICIDYISVFEIKIPVSYFQ